MIFGILTFFLQFEYRRVFLAVLGACILTFPRAIVAGPTILHTFSALESSQASIGTNDDGAAPPSQLALGNDGYLYGTTSQGGATGAGSIFRVSSVGSFSNLYSFMPATNNFGQVNYLLEPNALTLGDNGNFYGTTRQGGSNFTGSIFMISPSGVFSNLFTFASQATNSSLQGAAAAGAMPTGALALGSNGNFYGTTEFGGSNNTGTIFQITPSGAFTSLHSFAKLATGSTNGAFPNALMVGNDGSLYGTTQSGGILTAGTLFKIALTGVFSQLVSFDGNAPDKNPVMPDSALAEDANGNFYGTSSGGGSQGGGSIFEVTPTNVLELHSFPLLNSGAGAALTLDTNGVLYGTTAANGLNGNGTIFRLTPTGEFSAYAFSPLNSEDENSDGANSSATLTADGAGNLDGICAAGGTNGSGVIFQISPLNFIPPFFLASSNPPPPLTNTLVGASVTLSIPASGIAPLSYQWTLNGSNLTDGGEILGSATSNLMINPVLFKDVGSYALVISNIWGALTSPVTVLTVKSPGVSITSPQPNQRTGAPVFTGTATVAPLLTNADPNGILLTNVIFSITNLFNGSNITGTSVLTSGAHGATNWTFTATPYPGTNILFAQSVDVSGNMSPAASVVFFYEEPTPVTVLTTGSGTATYTITNGALLDIGAGYSITANPISSIFSNWVSEGATNESRTLSFVMQTNLVLTADLLARQPPSISIAFPTPNSRTASNIFTGTAMPSPLLPGVNPSNVQLSQVTYQLTNVATGVVSGGTATLTQSDSVTNWAITTVPLPGTNILALQSQDVSGGISRIVSRTFFYKSPTLFTVGTGGNGSGTFSGMAMIAGDTPPTNGALLNIGETYQVTAKPNKGSHFASWVSGGSIVSSQPMATFIMQTGFALTANFSEIPPTVSISSPAPNLRTAAPSFKGTASGHFPIASVSYSVANSHSGSVINGDATLASGAGSVSNWSFALTPAPGTNVLTVFSTDTNGVESAMTSRKFFYEVPARLTVTNADNGKGSFRGAANGAILNIGEGYSIMAIPDKSSLFSNWFNSIDSASTSAATLSFVMDSNLVLTATFVTNFFPAAAGTYTGLFFPAEGVSAETSGMVYNLALRGTGVFSGHIAMAETNYNIAGSFDASSNAAFNVGPLQVDLNLNIASNEITGTISSPNFTADLTAELSSTGAQSAGYTFVLSPSTNDTPLSPPGDGQMRATNKNGVVTVSGTLGDGTRFNQIVPASENGDVPVFVRLYTRKPQLDTGLLLGWINLTNSQITNTLTWIKKPLPASSSYTNGFTNLLFVNPGP